MQYQLWDGERVVGSLEMAFDTETTVVDLKKEVPEGVLLTAWAGEGPVQIVPVERWSEFVAMHLDRKWVGHNSAFDFHVILKALQQDGPDGLAKKFVQLVEDNKMYCTMLLDGLVRIATGEADKGKDPESKQPTRNLETLAVAYGVDCAPPDKASGFRKRFGELLLEPDWMAPTVDPGFFLYAATDCVATYLLGQALLAQAWQLHRQIPPEKLHPRHEEWGPLTSSIQMKASIALAEISRRGIYVDMDKAWRAEARLRMQYQECVTWLEMNYPGLVQVTTPSPAKRAKHKRAKRKLTSKSLTCMMSLKTLRRILQEEAARLGIEAPVSDGKQHWISTKADDWAHHEDKSEFLTKWIFVKNAEKQLGYLANIRKLPDEEPILRSQYLTLKRTGRTGCRTPNIQQTPKVDWFRALHVARPGTRLFVCDYSFIELRTVAYCCEKWQGKSQLGQVIREGKDPHSFTAALMMQQPYDHVKKMVKEEKSLPDGVEKPYTKMRQSAKPLNFGSIGGLGPDRLAIMALLDYGIPMTRDEAATFLDVLITKVYPELNKENGWLSTNLPELLSDSLQIPLDEVFDLLITCDGNFGRLGICLDRVLRGCAVKKDGTPYNKEFVQKLWAFGRYLLAHSPTKRQYCHLFDTYQPSDEIGDLFYTRSAITPTGRIRRGLMYTDSKNTPFQSLAADGAKVALWNLWKMGVPVVAFIHDEIIAEVKEENEGDLIKQVMISSMEEVMEGFPVDVEGHIEECWKK